MSRLRNRSAQLARERKMYREERERDLITDPALLSDGALTAAISRQRLYLTLNTSKARRAELAERAAALIDEQQRRWIERGETWRSGLSESRQ